jgi:hypothetical protein
MYTDSTYFHQGIKFYEMVTGNNCDSVVKQTEMHLLLMFC